MGDPPIRPPGGHQRSCLGKVSFLSAHLPEMCGLMNRWQPQQGIFQRWSPHHTHDHKPSAFTSSWVGPHLTCHLKSLIMAPAWHALGLTQPQKPSYPHSENPWFLVKATQPNSGWLKKLPNGLGAWNWWWLPRLSPKKNAPTIWLLRSLAHPLKGWIPLELIALSQWLGAWLQSPWLAENSWTTRKNTIQ